jgi:tetratricopeptide (TPR) repeat protein
VAALKSLVLALAAQRPLAMIIEDVHWIDKATEEVVGAVVEAMEAAPLLFLLVYRPEYLHAWADKAYHARIGLSRLPGASSAEMVRAILSKPYASNVALARLSVEESKALVQELLGTTAIPSELEEFVATRTDGNPFFVEELTLALLESGDLLRENGGYALVRSVETLQLPTSLQGVLLARVDRLADNLKHVLQIASVIGRVFSYPVLTHVLGQSDGLDQALLDLEEFEFAYPTGLAPHREYSFKHVLTQQAVYDELLRSKREALHEQVGCAIEALYADRLEEHYELLAYHYSRTANTDKAIEYLDLANQKAARSNAIEEAYAYFERALAFLDMAPDGRGRTRRRLTLLLNQSTVMLLLFKFGRYQELLSQYERDAIELGDDGLVGRLYGQIAWCDYWFGRFDEGIERAARAAELCEATNDPEGAGTAYVVAQWCSLFKGDLERTVELKHDVLRMTAQRFHLRWVCWTLQATLLAYLWLGKWPQALQARDEELKLGEEFRDNSVISVTTVATSFVYVRNGERARALKHAEFALERAPSLADRIWAQGAVGWARCWTGEVDRGVEALAEVVSAQRAVDFVPIGSMYWLYLCEGLWLAGRLDEAIASMQELAERAERHGMKLVLGSAHRLLGEALSARQDTPGRSAEACSHFEQSIAILRRINAENELALAYAGYGRQHKRQGRIAEARDDLTRALEIFERLGTLIEPDKVRTELAELPAV